MRLVDRVAVSLQDASDDGSLIGYLAAGGDATRLAEVALLAIERAGYTIVRGAPSAPDDFGPLTLR